MGRGVSKPGQDFETMTRNAQRQERLASDIHRQFGADQTRRFLRTLPAFQVVTDIPEHLRDLLERLKEREDSPAD